MPRFRLFSLRHPHPSIQANGNPDGHTALLSHRQPSAPNPVPSEPDCYGLPSEVKNKPDSGVYTTLAQKTSPALKTCHNVLELILPEPADSARRPRKLLPKLHKLSKLQPSCTNPGHTKPSPSRGLSDTPSNRPRATRSRAMSFGRSAFTADRIIQPPSPESLQRSHTTLPLQQHLASKSPTSHAHLACPRFHCQDAHSAAHPQFNGVVGSQTHIVQALSRPSQGDDSEDCAPMSPSISSQMTPGGHLNSQAHCSSSESHHSSSSFSFGHSSAECVGPLPSRSSEDASDSEASTEAFSPHQRDMLKIMARYGKSISKPAVSPRLTDVGFYPWAVSIPIGDLGGDGTEKCSKTDSNPTGTSILSHRSIKRAFASSPDLKQLARTRSAWKKDEEPEARWESPLGIKSQDPRLERFEALLRASDASTGGTIKLSLSPNIDPSCQQPPSLPRLRLSHNFFGSSATVENDSEILESICPVQV